MKKIITTTHFRRPDYSSVTTRALAEQPDAKDWHYIASIDRGPDAPEICNIIRTFKDAFASMQITGNLADPSCNRNTKRALSLALRADADFILMVEDDVLLGHDALSFFSEQAVLHKDDPNIFTISAWRHPDGWLPESGVEKPEGEDMRTSPSPWFTPWGWGTWSDRLTEMLEKWTTGSDHSKDHDCESWDRVLGLPQGVRGNRMELQPMISRAQNIGKHKGTHRGDLILSHWIGEKP